MKIVRFIGGVVYLVVAVTFGRLVWKFLAHPAPSVTVAHIVISAVLALLCGFGAYVLLNWEKWRARK